VNQFLAISKNFYAELFVIFELVRRCAANGSQLAAWNFSREKIFRVMLAHVAHADDSDAHLFHDSKFRESIGRGRKTFQEIYRSAALTLLHFQSHVISGAMARLGM
jgi:hypothetical protein